MDDERIKDPKKIKDINTELKIALERAGAFGNGEPTEPAGTLASGENSSITTPSSIPLSLLGFSVPDVDMNGFLGTLPGIRILDRIMRDLANDYRCTTQGIATYEMCTRLEDYFCIKVHAGNFAATVHYFSNEPFPTPPSQTPGGIPLHLTPGTPPVIWNVGLDHIAERLSRAERLAHDPTRKVEGPGQTSKAIYELSYLVDIPGSAARDPNTMKLRFPTQTYIGKRVGWDIMYPVEAMSNEKQLANHLAFSPSTFKPVKRHIDTLHRILDDHFPILETFFDHYAKKF